MTTQRTRSSSRGALCVLLAAVLGACGGDPLPPVPDGPAVGMQRFNWTDDTRRNWAGDAPRPVTATVWYPAAAVEQEAILIPQKRPVFIAGYAARNATLADSDRPLPVVVISHGTGGAALQMMWLGRALAARGYVAVAVDHHGNTAAEPAYDARGFRLVWERITDLSVAIDRLAADETFGARVDTSDVSAVGFSLGGYTVLGLAGAKTDLDRLQAFCAGPDADGTCEPQGEYPTAAEDFAKMLEEDPSLAANFRNAGADYSDPRVSHVVAIAPAIGQAFAPATLRALDEQFLLIVGNDDRVAPALTNAAYIESHLSSGRLQTIEDAGHYVFLSPCTKRGRRYVPAYEDADTIDRARVHEDVAAAIIEFLGHTD
ncbi:MAG: alpha/beta hydrolase [Pseudomonadota bacterium]